MLTAKIKKLHNLTAKKQLPILLKMHACRQCTHLWAISDFFSVLGVGDPGLRTYNPCFVAWPLELGLMAPHVQSLCPLFGPACKRVGQPFSKNIVKVLEEVRNKAWIVNPQPQLEGPRNKACIVNPYPNSRFAPSIQKNLHLFKKKRHLQKPAGRWWPVVIVIGTLMSPRLL